MSLKAHFIGNLGKDAEIKQTKTGKEYISFTVAVNDKNGGEKETTWISVFAEMRFQKLVEYLKKGKSVQIIGQLRTSAYINKDNNPVVDLRVFPDSIDFISTGTSGGTASAQSAPAIAHNEEMACGIPKSAAAPAPSVAKAVADVPDDDLPF